jgi:general L-amino acid transport system substrate-binding protein
MVDAYAVQRCHAIAGEATWLAQQRARAAPGVKGRLLPEALEVFPVIAATGTADGRWSAIVAWTITTLINGDRPDTTWYAGGARAMPLAAPELGLLRGWQERVLAVTGSYGAITARYLGPGSAVPLEAGPGASTMERNLLLAPYVE